MFATSFESDTGAATFLLSEPVLLAAETDCTQNRAAHPIDDYCQDPRERRHFLEALVIFAFDVFVIFYPYFKRFSIIRTIVLIIENER